MFIYFQTEISANRKKFISRTVVIKEILDCVFQRSVIRITFSAFLDVFDVIIKVARKLTEEHSKVFFAFSGKFAQSTFCRVAKIIFEVIKVFGSILYYFLIKFLILQRVYHIVKLREDILVVAGIAEIVVYYIPSVLAPFHILYSRCKNTVVYKLINALILYLKEFHKVILSNIGYIIFAEFYPLVFNNGDIAVLNDIQALVPSRQLGEFFHTAVHIINPFLCLSEFPCIPSQHQQVVWFHL